MMKLLKTLLILSFAPTLWAGSLIEDGGVGLDREELEAIVKSWDPGMRQEAMVDKEARKAFLEQALANKRLAAEVDRITARDDPAFYWKTQLAFRTVKLRAYLDRYREQIEVPDMESLAREQYLAYKEKYAAVPEKRASSHILIKCLPGVCDRNEKRPEAEAVLEKLRKGESFEALVARYSEDPGTRERKGSLGKWVWKGEAHMVRPYLAALFDLDKVGDYSGLVESRFGFHIIRLDGIRKEKYLPLEEVRDKIIETLRERYRTLAMIELNKSYLLSDKARIDEAALDRLFAELADKRHHAGNK